MRVGSGVRIPQNLQLVLVHTGHTTVDIGAYAALALLLSCDRVTRRELVVAGVFCFLSGRFDSGSSFAGAALAAFRFEPGESFLVACWDGTFSLAYGPGSTGSSPSMAPRSVSLLPST